MKKSELETLIENKVRMILKEHDMIQWENITQDQLDKIIKSSEYKHKVQEYLEGIKHPSSQDKNYAHKFAVIHVANFTHVLKH